MDAVAHFTPRPSTTAHYSIPLLIPMPMFIAPRFLSTSRRRAVNSMLALATSSLTLIKAKPPPESRFMTNVSGWISLSDNSSFFLRDDA